MAIPEGSCLAVTMVVFSSSTRYGPTTASAGPAEDSNVTVDCCAAVFPPTMPKPW
jgi:hypothetical protein